MTQQRPEDSTPLGLRGGQASEFLSRMITKPALVLFILFIATIVQMIRRGASPHYWLLLGGSAAAGLLMLGFGLLVITDAGAKRRGLLPALLAFGGLVPYAFGCLLVFYEGFWRLIRLFWAFSFSGLVVSVLFVLGGFVIVNGMYRLSSFARQVDERKIVIQRS